jgi:orotate phosphoribosyltransferase
VGLDPETGRHRRVSNSKRDHALTSVDIDLSAPSGPSSRLTKSRSADEVAELILKAGIIKTYETEPFVFTSGAHSPVYIRGLLSQVEIRERICAILAQECAEIAAAANVDVLIGGETAGIPFAAIAASKIGLPMGYARKKAKAFGMKEMIEGLNASGRRAILVEDLTTDGQSKVSFAEQIRGCGCTLNWVASIFYYGIYPSAEQVFEGADLSLRYLCDWSDILSAARRVGGLPAARIEALGDFLKNPTGWRP